MKSSKLLLVMLAALTATLFGCNRTESAAAPKAATVGKTESGSKDPAAVVIPASEQEGAIEVQPVQLANQPEALRAAGRIALDERSTWRVGVRTNGMVRTINVGLGDYVRKDQILARYHADEVRDTRAQYRTAVSARNLAEASVAQAQRNYDRAMRLLELKASSVQQVEMAKQAIASAQAEVRKAEIEVDRTKDLLEDDLQVPADPPAGSDETADLVPIRAPAAGYIIEKNVTPGKTVDETTDTFVIGDLSRLWMIAAVNENDIAKIHVGQQAHVTVNGFPNDLFKGRVANLGEAFDPVTRSMRVRIELENSSMRLRPEMLASAQIEAGPSSPRLMVSSDAVQQVNEQDVVFVKKDADHFEVRPVRISEPVDGRVTVLEGLKPGETVVTRGSFIVKSQLLKSSLEAE